MKHKIKLKWRQYVLYCILLCNVACVDKFSSMPIPQNPDCSWDYSDVGFDNVSLALPECVDILGMLPPPYTNFGNVFWVLTMNNDASGIIQWTATDKDCSSNTMSVTSNYTSTDNYDDLITMDRTLYEVQTRALSAEDNTAMVQANITGNLTIKVDNVLNQATGEYVTLTWDSPEYSGTNGFYFLDFIGTAKVAKTSGIRRVYIHNQFVQL